MTAAFQFTEWRDKLNYNKGGNLMILIGAQYMFLQRLQDKKFRSSFGGREKF